MASTHTHIRRNFQFILPFLIFNFCFLLIYAQPVTIQGHADYYKGKTIAAYTYKDLITYTPLMIGSATVNDTGYFSITLPNIQHSQYLYLNIENLNGSIYVTPGKTFRVIFPPPDTTHYENPFVSHKVELGFLSNDPRDINNIIIDFNQQFDLFWRKYYTYFVRKEATAVLDSFAITMRQRYVDVKNKYFWGYLDYTLAEIGINILEGQKTLGDKYLKGKPVLYHNYEYMKFFNDYYKDYLEQYAISRLREGDDVDHFIDAGDYKDLMAVMQINPILRSSDSLCELVMIKGLYELYYSGNYDKNNISTLLRTIASTTKIKEDSVIAGDMLSSFTGIMRGGNAPEFTLEDADGNESNIIDYRGKYLYLCFYKSSVSQCMAEFDVMTALRRKYGRKIYFVCISEDNSYADMQHFLNQNKIYNWTFLFDKGHKVLKLYNVKALPEFFLITPRGEFYRSPADPPSHGIQQTFDDVLSRKN